MGSIPVAPTTLTKTKEKGLIVSNDLVMRDPDGNVFTIKDGAEVFFNLCISSENTKQLVDGVETSLTKSVKILVVGRDWFLSDTENNSSDVIRSDQIRKIPVIGLMLYTNCITQLFKVATKHG